MRRSPVIPGASCRGPCSSKRGRLPAKDQSDGKNVRRQPLSATDAPDRAFSQFGTVSRPVVTDRETGRSRGFLEMADGGDAAVRP